MRFTLWKIAKRFSPQGQAFHPIENRKVIFTVRASISPYGKSQSDFHRKGRHFTIMKIVKRFSLRMEDKRFESNRNEASGHS